MQNQRSEPTPGEVMNNPRLFHFFAGEVGHWRIRDIRAITGASLESAERLDICDRAPVTTSVWHLQGVRSNERYTTNREKNQLSTVQENLGRDSSTCAVLIPIKKSEAWWTLSQDERREIFEERSRHTSFGIRFLPAIARRLYHCRDLSTAEKFDFLTWFEFAPEHEPLFDELLDFLRNSQEWTYVTREVDIRLER